MTEIAIVMAYTSILFFGLRGWQLIIVVVAVLLVFGANKIPEMMRNLGKGVHSFRQGIEDAKAEINKEVKRADPPEGDKDEQRHGGAGQ